MSLFTQYARATQERLRQRGSRPTLIEAHLSRLPPPVRRYLRKAGVLGRPRVHHFKASWQGRIRAGADEPWMEFTAEQHNWPNEPARFFFMKAKRSGVPLDVYHAFAGGTASMRVRLLSLFPLVDARGPEMTRAETVTLFNDICVLAPAELVDPEIHWQPLNDRSARGHYTVGSNTVSAVLWFGETGDLVDFVSDDRLAASRDGKHFVQQRWSTPVGQYRNFGPVRVPGRGEGRWHPPEGEYAYLEIELLDLQLNPGVQPS
ncbi:MAG: hypothetical protein MJD61_03045 [Proteobacteria bacterium]|nr:hypothetical protein [Pseudomonadota bacterium]